MFTPLFCMLNDQFINQLKRGLCVYEHLANVIAMGGARDYHEALRLVNDAEYNKSLMYYLIKLERYEDAQFVKELCDKIKDHFHPNTVHYQDVLRYRDEHTENPFF